MVIPIIDNEKCNTSKNASANIPNFNNNLSNLEKKEIIGNRKEFRLNTNRKRLRIIGNGNKIIIYTNEGILDVIGSMSKVKIIYNCGKINIIGNNSKVYVGKESPVTKIQCTGSDIKFKLLSKELILTPNRDNSNHQHQKDKQKSASTPSSPTQQKTFDTIYINNNTIYCNTTTGCSHHVKTEDASNLDKFLLKNNISLPNLDILSKIDLCNSIKISDSTSNIFTKNSCSV